MTFECGMKEAIDSKKIKVRGVAEAKRAPQVHSSAFRRGLGFDEALHRPNGHGRLPHGEFKGWMQ
jgi:hypothetical protein